MKQDYQLDDHIFDVEDGDCYFEGIVKEIDDSGLVKKYLVTRVFWSGIDEKDDDYIGQVIEPMWWYIKKAKEI